MQILIKFPTRERAGKFREVVSKYIEMQETENVLYFITLDSDCPHLDQYIEICQQLGLMYSVGESKGKIHACNRDMNDPQLPAWDIVVLASDDMIPQKRGWDKTLIEEMQTHFPDTDGVLYHWDGYTTLNTMCILGRKYFDRFGYIYHPSYLSLFCDNEFMEVSRALGKEKYFEEVLFKHEHWSNNPHVKPDNLMRKNERLYNTDKANYEKRKAIGFELRKLAA